MCNRVPTPSTTLFAIVLVLTVSSSSFGQGATPQRGFHPGGSYVMSDIETINTNLFQGNVMLNFPLAKLPPGRSGLTAGINLHYDSKIYDSRVEYYPDFDYGTPPDPFIVERNLLIASAEGGWSYGMRYELQLIDRLTGYYQTPAYPDTKAIYRWKVKMVFPDGSVHEFLPRGFGTQGEGDGYYNFRPDGWQTVWINAPYWTTTEIQGLAGATHYYTFDGSYLRLDVEHDSNGNWWDNPWTLTFPDGTRVSQSPTQPQRITDRNGNYIEQVGVTYNGHPAVGLRDQENRQIGVETLGEYDIVHNTGFGGADLTYEVHWKTVQVGGKEYQTVEPTVGPNPNGYPSPLSTLWVVSEIRLPSQSGPVKYTFGYNAQDYGSVPWGTPSVGLGELSSISLLADGVQQYNVSYNYYLDNDQFGPIEQFIWYNLLKNRVTRKTLTYNETYDATTSPVTEITNYLVGAVETPDGGVISQSSDPQRVYSTQNADGTVVEKVWAGNPPQNFPVAYQIDPWSGMNTYDPARANGFVKWEITSIRDQNNNLAKSAIKEFTQDKNGNVTGVTEYDWVSYFDVPRNSFGTVTGIPASALKRRVTSNTLARPTPNSTDTSTDHANSYWNYSTLNLRNAVSSIEIGNGTSTLSRTELVYDNAGSTGNVTQQKVWDSTKGALPLTTSNSISISNQYDSNGNVIQSTDARGTQTSFTYGAINGFSNLYPT